MPSYTLKQFDTYPPLVTNLADSSGASGINLTAASSVYLVLKGVASGAVIHGQCTIASAAVGLVQYAWGPSDTAIADTYNGEFQINWAAGGIQKVPNDSTQNFTVLINQSLDGSVG